MARKNLPKRAPRSCRPYMPGYEMMFVKNRGSLPWTWAAKRLSASHNYWLATTRPDGRPHVMLVWGVWIDDAFYFSTDQRSRKSRNLAANPNCVVCPEGAGEAVILEGIAEEVTTGIFDKAIRRCVQEKVRLEGGGERWPVLCGSTPRRVRVRRKR